MSLRVAIRHTDRKHPDAHWAAYRYGTIQSFIALDGTSTPPDAVAVLLLDQARSEKTDGYEVQAQRLCPPDVEGDDHQWLAVDEDALRQRAAGEPVDVPLATRATKTRKQTAGQEAAATVED